MDQEAINDNVITLLETIKQEKQERERQAVEYERRLKDLNGEAGRIRDILKESIPREVFDRTMSEKDQRFERMVADLLQRIEEGGKQRETLSRRLTAIETSDTTQNSSRGNIVSVIGVVCLVITVIVLLINNLLKK